MKREKQKGGENKKKPSQKKKAIAKNLLAKAAFELSYAGAKLSAVESLKAIWEGNGTTKSRHQMYNLTRIGFIGSLNKKKAAIVKAVQRTEPHERTVTLIYYPAPNEALLFADASQKVMGMGPGWYFPGCVGAVSVYSHFKAHQKEESYYEIDYMQGSYYFPKSSGLTRELVTKHGGWRHHLLEQVFLQAKKNGIRRVVLNLRSGLKRTQRKYQKGIFEQVAKKHGFEPVKGKYSSEVQLKEIPWLNPNSF